MKSDPPKQIPVTSSGVTATERFLYAQCQRSYLQLWSYANLFRDQGKGSQGDGKEICDVIAVFGNVVILFSDKSCVFPNTGDEAIDWNRWHRRAVEASKKQLSGAERWIRSFPNRIFLDRKCTLPLPIELSAPDKLRVFKICVVVGAAERFRQKYPGSSGSLFLTTISPDEAPPPNPFIVNLFDGAGDIYHVIDDVTLPVLLKELDTLPDLIEYLEAKEALIRQKKISAIAGEEELIGLFLGLRAGIVDMKMPPGTHGMIGECIYRDILTRPEYRKHKALTAPSYFWDSIIAYQSAATLSGTLLPGSVVTIKENEEILRLLAAQPRLCRRYLGNGCLDLYQVAPRDQVTSRVMRGADGTIFVFRISPSDGTETIEQRLERQQALQAYCFLTAWRNRDVSKVVGICATGIDPTRDGFDLVAFEVLEWTEDGIAAGRAIAEQFAEEVTSPLAGKWIDLPHPLGWIPNDRPHTNRKRTEERSRRRQQRKAERKRRGR